MTLSGQRPQDNPNRFLFYEAYTDDEGITQHKTTPHYKAASQRLVPFILTFGGPNESTARIDGLSNGYQRRVADLVQLKRTSSTFDPTPKDSRFRINNTMGYLQQTRSASEKTNVRTG